MADETVIILQAKDVTIDLVANDVTSDVAKEKNVNVDFGALPEVIVNSTGYGGSSIPTHPFISKVDPAIANSLFSFELGRLLEDIALASDYPVLHLEKISTDIIATTEETLLNIGKYSYDSAIHIETISLDVNKASSDTAFVAEYGGIYTQDYVDEGYVEAGYVGQFFSF